ncbi:sensor domain-containing diguanylate cyclase [Desulfonatronovibrio magnus]|uniref:sensor domain-containing diguanylate cyclase n=1 Tax=Desulfonatronovibrio magnus TaxID=698827 RepID=UPI000695EA2F|nr:diguanylate cyclase [Desulfonatronovibrio magnus]
MHYFSNTLRENKRILILILLGLSIWAFLSFFLKANYNEKKNSYMSAELDSFKSKVFTTLEMYETFTEYIFYNDINTDKVLDLMAIATQSNDEQLQSLRWDLYDLLIEQYQLLQKYNFRQLHFILPGGDSFLRLHAPHQYGDNLLTVRDTIRIADQERRYITGFEEGRIFNGYRSVFPLFKDDHHLGSVEISISMASIMKVMASLYPSTALKFVLCKDMVESVVFDVEQINYTPAPFFPSYMLDKEVFQIYQDSLSTENYTTYSRIVEDIVRTNQSQINALKSFNTVVSYNDVDYMVAFLSIENLSHEHVAYLIGIYQAKTARIFGFQTFFREWLFVTLFFMLFFISVWIYDRKQKQLNHLACTDKLTRIMNRHRFLEIVEREVIQYQRYQRDFSVILLDIDHFKRINDQYGHNAGDDVLKQTAIILKSCARKQDAVARWGGEEFILQLPETGAAQAARVAERIRQAMADHLFVKGIRLTASMGVAAMSEVESQDIDVLVNCADEKLYQAKKEGRNRVVIYLRP